WRGYDLPRIIRGNSSIGVSYGLITRPEALQAAALPLAVLISKIAQSAYLAAEIGTGARHSLQTAAALAELLSQGLEDIRRYGRSRPSSVALEPPNFDWLTATGAFGEWEDVGLRACLAAIAFIHDADGVRA